MLSFFILYAQIIEIKNSFYPKPPLPEPPPKMCLSKIKNKYPINNLTMATRKDLENIILGDFKWRIVFVSC